MVKNLLKVKPTVPQSDSLDRRLTQWQNVRRSLSRTRYTSPESLNSIRYQVARAITNKS